MLRTVLQFSAICLAAAYSLTFAIVWYFKLYAIVEIVNVMTFVAIGLALVAFPMLGSGGFARAHATEKDPRSSESGPTTLDNRARGVVLLSVAALWLVAGIAVHKAFGG